MSYTLYIFNAVSCSALVPNRHTVPVAPPPVPVPTTRRVFLHRHSRLRRYNICSWSKTQQQKLSSCSRERSSTHTVYVSITAINCATTIYEHNQCGESGSFTSRSGFSKLNCRRNVAAPTKQCYGSGSAGSVSFHLPGSGSVTKVGLDPDQIIRIRKTANKDEMHLTNCWLEPEPDF